MLPKSRIHRNDYAKTEAWHNTWQTAYGSSERLFLEQIAARALISSDVAGFEQPLAPGTRPTVLA